MRKIKVLVTVRKLTAVAAIAHEYDQELGPLAVSSRRKVARAISDYVGIYGDSYVDDHETEASEAAWDFAEKAYNKYYSKFKR